MSRRGHEAAELGILKWIVYMALGAVWFFWPLLIDFKTNPDGSTHVQWWAWLIEVPWLVIAAVGIGFLRSLIRKSK